MKQSREMFKYMVRRLCDIYKSNPGLYKVEFVKLEVALKASPHCSGKIWFGIFTEDSSFCDKDSTDIDFSLSYYTLCAEYYDGFQAPFTILRWSSHQVNELYRIVKEVTPALYNEVMKDED